MMDLNDITELSRRLLDENGYVAESLPERIGKTWRIKYLANGRRVTAFCFAYPEPLKAEETLRRIICDTGSRKIK
jgi:hypothetical protein